jgi:putative ABC transport system ATP-binding protein
MAVTGAAVDAVNLYRFFHTEDDEVLALRGVSLEVDHGEFIAVVGPSGSGKSTLLMCLAGLDEPDGGHVRVAGRMMTRRPEPERARLRAEAVGVLFQADNLVGHLDVDGNLATAQRLAGHVDVEARGQLLERMGLLPRRGALPPELSGGESVRAGLAVALINEPHVVIADEPTGELDSVTEQRVLELLAGEAKRGRAVIVATHSEAVAAEAHRVVQLVDGQVVSG